MKDVPEQTKGHHPKAWFAMCRAAIVIANCGKSNNITIKPTTVDTLWWLPLSTYGVDIEGDNCSSRSDPPVVAGNSIGR